MLEHVKRRWRRRIGVLAVCENRGQQGPRKTCMVACCLAALEVHHDSPVVLCIFE